MDTIEKLTEIFKSFPGIGPRQAKRFVYFLLTRNKSYIKEFTTLVEELQKEIQICQECYRYFTKGKQTVSLCNICSSKNRDSDSLMIVARDIDLENIEKSHSFNGKYFVLGGTVPILDKNPETKVRLRELLNTIEKRTAPASEAPSYRSSTPFTSRVQDVQGLALGSQPKLTSLEKVGLREIILGFSINPESEYTADFIIQALNPLITKYNLKISHLGRGLSTGTELEYSDSDTIKNALKNRS
jgi:recombinational DNA repair protein RecR